ncbi:hypothetical protein HELRODRAFT_158741 [Helobdella robusta]|uniref:Uncharacterized protein n=1 Tax=Helobdella robusta TaxID=6412 RepID=T1EN67_HELRO|nr:hypothetical protein HELRODRAFT_158741 [Helobdella robusta]ESO12262.1 hypothetical protein HELRODRAFT_158741 [Helobdella robusta]
MEKREKRKKNVVIYGVPESSASNVTYKKAHAEIKIQHRTITLFNDASLRGGWLKFCDMLIFRGLSLNITSNAELMSSRARSETVRAISVTFDSAQTLCRVTCYSPHHIFEVHDKLGNVAKHAFEPRVHARNQHATLAAQIKLVVPCIHQRSTLEFWSIGLSKSVKRDV